MELVGKVRPEACSFTRDDAVPDEVTMPGPTGCRCLMRSEDRWPDAFYAGLEVLVLIEKPDAFYAGWTRCILRGSKLNEKMAV